MKNILIDHCGLMCPHYATRCWFDFHYTGEPGKSVSPVNPDIEWDGLWGRGCVKTQRRIPDDEPEGDFPYWCPLPDAEEDDDES